MSAVGYYQHLLLKLQQQYHLNLCGVVDFAHDFSSLETVTIIHTITTQKTVDTLYDVDDNLPIDI